MSQTKERNLTIDFIKAIAIFGVLVIHVGSGVLTQTQIGSFAWTSGLLWGALVRGSVPLFLMASGAIMLNAAKPLSLKKLYFHNIARIVLAMLVWGFGYKLYHLVLAGQMNLSMIWYSLKRLLLFDQEFHFYYIHMILIVYVFLPITRLFAEKADKKLLEYALCIWGVFAVVYPMLRNFAPFTLLSGLTGQWAINLTFASVGYGLFGYYLTKYPFTFIKSVVCFLVGFILTFGATFILSYQAGALNEQFLQGTSPGVCLLAAGIFSLASIVKAKGIFKKMILCLSKASFCIYLSHMFILYILEHFGIRAQLLPALFSVPLLSVLVLLICLFVYGVLSSIPVLKKWII